MTFGALLAQLGALLQRQARVSYWALKRCFDLSDEDAERESAEGPGCYVLPMRSGAGQSWAVQDRLCLTTQ